MNNSDLPRLRLAAFAAIAGSTVLTACGSSSLYDKYFEQGMSLKKGKVYDQASNIFGLAEKQAQKFDVGDARRIAVWSQLASCYALQGSPSASDQYLKNACDEIAKNPKADRKDLISALIDTATAYDSTKDFKFAREWWRNALTLQSKITGKDGAETLKLAKSCAQSYANSGDLVEADHIYSKVLSLQEKKFGPTGAAILPTLEDYAGVLQREKKKPEFFKTLRRIYDLRIANKVPAKPYKTADSGVQW